MLAAIEDGDFTKVGLDLISSTILVTRTCLIPDKDEGTLIAGSLKMKNYMVR